MIRQVVKCGTAASPEYSLGVLAGNPLIHPRDTLTCVLMMLNCINPESNSHRHSVVTPRSCLWRLHPREDIVSVINRNCVVVISGETGSGKTTQAAEFIFQDYIREGQGARCNIVVTQPRRIAALSIAKRAALERHNELLLSHPQHLLPWNPRRTYNTYPLTTRDKARPSESPPDTELPLVCPIETSNLTRLEVIHRAGRGAQASAPSELLRAKDAL
ncbi:hypothetical protein HPB49_009828 [Dermacentor silvarum]|uniref:Uncharacterized protein n=1 Tax=Dermacentor silvarum TaxID=543639 RepID=A0ACB8DYM3_DERSI|nr:hypothetical protein HPB49_009828 [Dermacentor silvarum]